MAVSVENSDIIEAAKKESNTVFYPSAHKFLSGHNGYRKGCLHIVLGMEGGGKSTLMRSMLFDFLAIGRPKKNILIYLSEETSMSFQCEFFRGFAAVTSEASKIKMFSEQDDDQMAPYEGEHALVPLISEVDMVDPEIVFIDNLTTADFYPDNFKVQGPTIKRIKKLAQEKNIPIVIFAHTNGINSGTDRLIESNDIRGGKGVSMLAEFFYIMQRVETENGIFPTVRITKHRGQDLAYGNLFSLDYAKNSRLYKSSSAIPFDAFNEHFKNRKKLGRK